MSGNDVCYSVGFGTLVGVFVFSVMWSKLLMASAINICPFYACCSCRNVFMIEFPVCMLCEPSLWD